MTTEAIAKPNQFMIRYQCGLAIASVFIFFTNLDIYLPLAKIIPLEPLVYIFALTAASIPLLVFSSLSKRGLPQNLMRWCIAYIFISVFAFWLYPSLDEPFQEIKNRILALLFIFTTSLVYSEFYIVQKSARFAIIAANLMSVANNIYEFLNPGIFAGINETGRAAGFYLDANSSGDALVLGMILGLGVLPVKYRIPFALLSGIGVFVTLSRGALVGWIIVMFILSITGAIPSKQLLGWMIGLVLGISLLTQSANLLSQLDMPLFSRDVMARLEGFTTIKSDGGDVEDTSSIARKLVLKLGWEKFLEKPWIGNGLGSALFDVGALVDHEISTHNTYLLYMVEHGILGTFVLPLAVFASTYPSRGEGRNVSFAFAVFVIMWGFFSHTILNQRLHLLTFSLMAMMNQTTIRTDSTNPRESEP
jgi:hypothetical protein